MQQSQQKKNTKKVKGSLKQVENKKQERNKTITKDYITISNGSLQIITNAKKKKVSTKQINILG